MGPLDRIEAKLDKIADVLSEHSASLAVHGQLHSENAKQLAEHIRRTNLLEEKLEPVEAHVASVNTIIKVVGFITTISGVIFSYLKFKGR